MNTEAVWDGKTSSKAYRDITGLCRKRGVGTYNRGERLYLGDDGEALMLVPGCRVSVDEADEIVVRLPRKDSK